MEQNRKEFSTTDLMVKRETMLISISVGHPVEWISILVQYPGLPAEGSVATNPNPPPLRVVRKSASILEQPHPGNTSEKMDDHEIKMVSLADQSLCIPA